MKKKRLAYAFDEDTATSMVQRSEDDDNMYDCKSFTDDYIWYEVELRNGHLSRFNRVTDIPYTLRSDIVVEADTIDLNYEELAVTGINFADTTNNSTSDNDICQGLADSIDSLQRDKIKVINHASKTSYYMMKEAADIPQILPERQR
ncbi:hypothetical protein CU097_011627 [Rhizopus azygosporus]|uniref:Uncharacterized protein n=1 Tax=Rhizopus azygosporus TaxID=86630 RepID=A0A367JQL0_RHIAZ|nr:hypothetical protein CU097_011627 [Rhizopus azygosporus]